MFRSFESIQPGAKASLTKRIAVDDVKRFVEMTGDDNPLHVDRAYAESTSFKDIVVHGMLGASFLSTIIGTQLPGPGALWLSQSMDFLLPVRLGDELTITATVLKKHDGERLLDLATTITNQHGQVVLTGTGKVRMLEPVAPVAQPTEPRKVTIVTGAAGGIGSEISRELARRGHAVIVNYLSSDARARALVDEIRAAGGDALAVRANVADPGDAAMLVERATAGYGTVSGLVNNASGRIAPKQLGELTWAEVDEHLQVQLRGALQLMQAVVPVMKAQGFGRIVNITTQAIDATPTIGWTAYAAAKAALAAVSRNLAAELGPHGIRINCVAPGLTDTRLVADISERQRAILARQNPTRRLGAPTDVAGAVAYLLSSDADFVNGETLRVNGGAVMM